MKPTTLLAYLWTLLTTASANFVWPCLDVDAITTTLAINIVEARLAPQTDELQGKNFITFGRMEKVVKKKKKKRGKGARWNLGLGW
jgi:hypothetical protein